ncbi:hypothetical protein [Streptomyces europaeiscabiei]|uniref:hypothetical protein n=1 Tax=Streptomyces europaeiscabiei TaxID=146819 RepID=UPI002E13AB0E|nr:hypothetical protein OHB30_03875 [Streptomyces europaeiscabiei]
MPRLSESRRLQREDGGVKPALLHRGDIFFRAWSRHGAAGGRQADDLPHPRAHGGAVHPDSTVTHDLGTQVVREDDAGVHLVWTTEFAPASLLDFTTTNMRAAAELMKAMIDTAYANQR